MSDLLAAAAAAMGSPEHLVERSAQARATAEGIAYEEVLAAWAGGTAAPVTAAPPAPTQEPAPAAAPAATTPTEEPASPPVTAPPPPMEMAEVPAVSTVAAPVMAHSQATPRLEGVKLHPLSTWLSMAALFAIGLVITFIGPFNTGADSRHVVAGTDLSAIGEQGQSLYLHLGCGYCHTQLVRPVLADVGLGPVTEAWADSLEDATFGVQRIGPDLAHAGSRASYEDGEELVSVEEYLALLARPGEFLPEGDHPPYEHLSNEDLLALATYLTELE
ncbi:MAG: c-type cytochrome [Acidimicrobiia bacterium]|nr:c-type cytochrome [Acidimicrobiia bacterium]MYD05219.1 c-type cytochrome [Acidimicrobiia bacterium]MYH54998.1 c-type cytochrome [Acidimicrobiia bacterium]